MLARMTFCILVFSACFACNTRLVGTRHFDVSTTPRCVVSMYRGCRSPKANTFLWRQVLWKTPQVRENTSSALSLACIKSSAATGAGVLSRRFKLLSNGLVCHHLRPLMGTSISTDGRLLHQHHHDIPEPETLWEGTHQYLPRTTSLCGWTGTSDPVRYSSPIRAQDGMQVGIAAHRSRRSTEAELS